MMSNRTTVLLSLMLLVLAALSGCEDEQSPPPDLIEEDTYIDLLVEMQMVKSLQETVVPDSNVVDSLIPKVMNRYGVTEEQFKRSHDFYQQQISEQQRRISEAIDRLRMDQSVRDRDPSPELE